jgi:hypothetical protein
MSRLPIPDRVIFVRGTPGRPTTPPPRQPAARRIVLIKDGKFVGSGARG